MKKFLLLLIATLSLSLAACGGTDTKADEAPKGGEAEAAPAEGDAAAEGAPKKELKKFEGNKMEAAEEDE